MARIQPVCASVDPGGPDSFLVRPELRYLKVIALEEHISYPEIFKNLNVDNHASRTLDSRIGQITQSYAMQRVTAASEPGISDMDENGIAVQILGLSGSSTRHIWSERR